MGQTHILHVLLYIAAYIVCDTALKMPEHSSLSYVQCIPLMFSVTRICFCAKKSIFYPPPRARQSRHLMLRETKKGFPNAQLKQTEKRCGTLISLP